MHVDLQPPATITSYTSSSRNGAQRYRVVWTANAPERKPRPFPRIELPLAPRRGLDEDAVLLAGRFGSFVDDGDAELASWPEGIDQTRLGEALSHGWLEDDEDDDPDTGIDDEPHDARDEDGV